MIFSFFLEFKVYIKTVSNRNRDITTFNTLYITAAGGEFRINVFTLGIDIPKITAIDIDPNIFNDFGIG
ncbi:hypothetical protein D3C85_1916100 [compost metagenome]